MTVTVVPSTTPKVIIVEEPGDKVVVTLVFSGDNTTPLAKSVPDTLIQLVTVVTDILIVTGPFAPEYEAVKLCPLPETVKAT